MILNTYFSQLFNLPFCQNLTCWKFRWTTSYQTSAYTLFWQCMHGITYIDNIFCIVFHQNVSKLSILGNFKHPKSKRLAKNYSKDSSKRFESLLKDSSALDLPHKSINDLRLCVTSLRLVSPLIGTMESIQILVISQTTVLGKS
jgi:hypothetical protein